MQRFESISNSLMKWRQSQSLTCRIKFALYMWSAAGMKPCYLSVKSGIKNSHRLPLNDKRNFTSCSAQYRPSRMYIIAIDPACIQKQISQVALCSYTDSLEAPVGEMRSSLRSICELHIQKSHLSSINVCRDAYVAVSIQGNNTIYLGCKDTS